MAYAGEAGTLLPGQTEVLTAGLAFGNYEQASIYGYKFNDLNDNGVDNSEPRLAGCDDRAGRHQRPGQCGLGQHDDGGQRRVFVHRLGAGVVHGERAKPDRLDANDRRGDVHAHQRPGGGGVCRRGGHAAARSDRGAHRRAGLRQLRTGLDPRLQVQRPERQRRGQQRSAACRL